MSDQEELEVFLFSQSYMLKVFFSGQKELEVFLFHIVCKMLFFFYLVLGLLARGCISPLVICFSLFVFVLQRRALKLKATYFLVASGNNDKGTI